VFNIGGAEFLVILLVALLVLGPNKLPQAARQVGHFLGEFRRVADGFQQELKSAMDVDAPAKPTTKPTTKPKSPGGPTDRTAVIDADSTEGAGDKSDDAATSDALDEPAPPGAPEMPDADEGPETVDDAGMADSPADD